jgi:glycosyltransferase involved in cell wall biosynthesis
VKRPLVSVLTPSFNQARWLGDNLHSVGCQTYPLIEHIVMDGGSSDESVAMLERTHHTLTWRSEPDRGQSHALNKAFAASTGEIIGWLNSDDAFWDCGVVDDVARFFATHPAADVVFGHAASVDEEGLVQHFFRVPPRSGGWLLRRYNYLIQPSVFVRRAVLGETLVDETFHFAMDYELWLRLSAAGARFMRIDRVLAIDRVQRERKSRNLLHVLAADSKRLAARYGVATSRGSRMLTAAYAVWCRLCGTPLIWRMPAQLAFGVQIDGLWPLIVRQCFSRRRDMSVGGR